MIMSNITLGEAPKYDDEFGEIADEITLDGFECSLHFGREINAKLGRGTRNISPVGSSSSVVPF